MSKLNTPEERSAYFSEFEKHGEQAVRVALTSYAWENEGTKLSMAKEWVRLKDEEWAATSSAKRDAREEATLRIVKRANLIAYVAAAIAAASIIKDIAVILFK